MKISKLYVLIVICFISILTIGAVSAESNADIVVSDADDSVMGVSVDSTDKVVQNDNVVGVSDAKSYVVNDTTYSDYFDDKGNLKDVVNAGDSLLINSLTDKVLNISKNVTIANDLNSGIITNSNIILSGDASGSLIKGLTFNNTNKANAISIDNGLSDISILNNVILMSTNKEGNFGQYDSIYAILGNGAINNVIINNNTINMDCSDVAYIYAIDFTPYVNWIAQDSGADNLTLSNNDIHITSKEGETVKPAMAEAIYLDGVHNTVFENNNVVVTTDLATTFNYGLQVADSSVYTSNENLAPVNVTIRNNTLNFKGKYMIYGITVISSHTDDDDEYDANILISSNYVKANSEWGVFAIGSYAGNVTIEFNNIIATGVNKPENITSSDSFKAGTSAIQIIGSTYDKVIVKNNNIGTSVLAINTTAAPEDTNIADNNLGYIIDEYNYGYFFDEDGQFIGDVGNGTTSIYLKELNNKNLIFTKSNISISGNLYYSGDCYSQNDCTIKIGNGVDEVSNVIISDLTMCNSNKVPITIGNNVKNVTIDENKLFLLNSGDLYYSAILLSGATENIKIYYNTIKVIGTAKGSYGIDVTGYDVNYMPQGNPKGIYISYNNIFVDVSNYAAGIYIDTPINTLIEANTVTVSSDSNNPAYGIATGDSSAWTSGKMDPSKNITISNNVVVSDTYDMIYGIEVFGGDDVKILNNTINATSEGGVFGVAIKVSNSIVKNNTIRANGGKDWKSASIYDSFGTGHAGLLLKDCKNINVSNNEIRSYYGEGNDYGVLANGTSNSKVINNIIVSNNKTRNGNYAVKTGNDTSVIVSNNSPKTVKIIASSLTKYYGDSKKLTVTLKDNEGKLIANKKVAMNINGKTYYAKTNAKGQATFTINNAKGTYKTAISFAADKNYFLPANKTITVKVVVPTFKPVKTTIKKGNYIKVLVKDAKSKPIKNQKIKFTVANKVYTVTTNAKGIAALKFIKKANIIVKVGFKSTATYGKTTKSFKVKVI